ncbi:MAG: DUF6503 family protein [Croceivirga sp.]
MKSIKLCFGVVGLLLFCSCIKKGAGTPLTAQQVVDSSIVNSGGDQYVNHDVTYIFRDRTYISENVEGKKVLKRITNTDSIVITDVLGPNGFTRFFNDSLMTLPDTLANSYANAVNSVHYFSRLPFGLNDVAVRKELLGNTEILGKPYYKMKVTFSQQNGGKDFEDIYLYWFGKKDFKPQYLAYKFYTNGGGIRFREAFNERYVNGIRFVDYRNFKPKKGRQVDFMKIDSVYSLGELELLSMIELKNLAVKPSP